MACFKSSIFKKLIKVHEHKPFKANWLKKEPPLSTVTVWVYEVATVREREKKKKKLVKTQNVGVQKFKLQKVYQKAINISLLGPIDWKKKPHVVQQKVHKAQTRVFSPILGNFNGDCDVDYDGDCDFDGGWNTFIFHNFWDPVRIIRTSWAQPGFRKLWRI